ncbi:helix-turn-helix domain-containing protein [Lactiplantibacillus pentosus]|uniref:Helix-turn-helix transcriptional regulator n=1 Tax=Lactiplantibacillus pentosus TaxID=1589 RepID=A0AAW8VW75_LACPE|nr:helix-turn-helix transcriptional regulator [Lactiplantibacillus pentosus]MBU7472552.1 helix-turn-helix transcriptional regulator [Lactiplantibacillus pentosus]MDT6990057.1 helix-turn-helix transcriptional regulator [Lactiplantibacillus pentosus]
MNTQAMLIQIKTWLKTNHKSQKWLAQQIGLSPAFLSQILSGTRKLQTKNIIAISKVTAIPLDTLITSEHVDNKEPQIVLGGSLSSQNSKKKIEQLLWDIQQCVDLEATIHDA